MKRLVGYAWYWLCFVTVLGAAGLKEICMDYIIANEETIKHTPQFKQLMLEPSLMYEILIRRKN